jgi:hypothetical protein
VQREREGLGSRSQGRQILSLEKLVASFPRSSVLVKVIARKWLSISHTSARLARNGQAMFKETVISMIFAVAFNGPLCTSTRPLAWKRG